VPLVVIAIKAMKKKSKRHIWILVKFLPRYDTFADINALVRLLEQRFSATGRQQARDKSSRHKFWCES
jgi:hypothetical protein